MNIVTISLKFQVVIPQTVREKIGVKPGQKMKVLAYDNKIIFIPVRPIQEGRGSLPCIDTNILREDDKAHY